MVPIVGILSQTNKKRCLIPLLAFHYRHLLFIVRPNGREHQLFKTSLCGWNGTAQLLFTILHDFSKSPWRSHRKANMDLPPSSVVKVSLTYAYFLTLSGIQGPNQYKYTHPLSFHPSPR